MRTGEGSVDERLAIQGVQLRKAATGNDGLDAIMEGGLPAGRCPQIGVIADTPLAVLW